MAENGPRMHLKTLIRYPIDIRRARRMLASRPDALLHPSLRSTDSGVGTGGRPVVLDLTTTDLLIDCGRHLMTLACWAQAIGSPFSIRCSRLILSAVARKIHGRELLSETAVRWLDPSSTDRENQIPAGALVLCDAEPTASRVGNHLDSGVTRLQMLIGRDIDRSIPVMPYPMHPATLQQLATTDLESLRATPRRCGVFFAGNQKRKYGDDKMQHEFGVVPRLELLQTLKQNFAPHIATRPCDDDATCPRGLPVRDRIVLVDSREHSIPASNWLTTIASAEFFLCCPGAAQPTCHHLIEAMSVGTIPLIEYGDRMTPPLEDDVNAVCFYGTDGLVTAIDRIESMSSAQIARLRQGAIAYYEQHLCGSRFMQALCDETIDLSGGLICVPFHEHNLYDHEAVPALGRSSPPQSSPGKTRSRQVA
ncbi:hypothetical protein [Stieleria varia]|uniref:hypothetical protein n=1 Tax=Stieleria varia TaxID=2528005 RepID=UPI0011B74C9A|nr:hypothetical protein [Stieleria varia]